jgi:hypothetical protein
MSPQKSHAQSLQDLLDREQLLNRIIAGLDGDLIIFENSKSIATEESLWEYRFQHLISRLYITYCDSGRKLNLNFFVGKIREYDADQSNKVGNYLMLIDGLRTIAQHYVGAGRKNGDKKRPQKKVDFSEKWLFTVCGGQIPITDDDWEKCFHKIMQESYLFLDALQACLIFITQGDEVQSELEKWKLSCIKRKSDRDYDMMIIDIMSDLGLSVNPPLIARIRKKNKESWNKLLDTYSSLTFEADLKREILDTIVRDRSTNMPLGIEDICDAFNLEPGDPKIYPMLIYARSLFTNPTNEYYRKEDLLTQLRINFG